MVVGSGDEDVTGKNKAAIHDDVNHHLNARTLAQEAFHFALCAGGILVFYFLFGIQQERITQGKYDGGEKFTYTQALVFFMCVANTIVAWATMSRTARDNVPKPMYMVCSASYLLAMITSNQALQYLPYPTQVLAKSCKPIPVIIFGVLFAHKKYEWKKYFFVVMIVVGVMLFLYKEKKGGQTQQQLGIGEFLLLASLVLDGTTTSIQDRINKKYHRTGQTMMYYMNLYSTFYLTVGLLLTGELMDFIGFVYRHPMVLSDMAILAVSSCGGQYFIFKTIAEFSPLTCSIITTTRKLFTIIISVIFMNHPLTERQIYGTVVVFTGLLLDAYYSKVKPPAQNKPPQRHSHIS
ncbi:hypothetical protein WR25_15615 [Diploscapter pachys]|uniref:Sugar phosphate transporter domain-containing protein n=1 Tax=Diploscapter pachys TaxID=2018661 RepID=A0A2A2M052_9BILA|nr:hypothetical protein WR25_15615 [Diploscapter pachys]